MTDKDVIEQVRGKKLDTPIRIVRVFHVSDPDYTYAFVRQEGPEALVVDDENGKKGGEETLKMFPADELVNVAVYQEALLAAHSSAPPASSDPQ